MSLFPNGVRSASSLGRYILLHGLYDTSVGLSPCASVVSSLYWGFLKRNNIRDLNSCRAKGFRSIPIDF